MSLQAELIAAHKARRARLGFKPIAPTQPTPAPESPRDKGLFISRHCTRKWGIRLSTDPIEPLAVQSVKFLHIKSVVLRKFNIQEIDLLSIRRTKNVVLPRHVLVYLARKHTLLSFPQIGRLLGGRDHTTALNSFNRITKFRAEDAALDALVTELEVALGVKPSDHVIVSRPNERADAA